MVAKLIIPIHPGADGGLSPSAMQANIAMGAQMGRWESNIHIIGMTIADITSHIIV